MSNYQFLNHQSPIRKAPLAAQGVMAPNAHIVAQPAPPKALYKQQSTPNIQGFRNIQPTQWGDIGKDFYNHINSEPKLRDVSPIRFNPREGKNIIPQQYNYQSNIVQKRDSIGLSNFRAERTPQHIRISRDISPFHRNMVINEAVEYPPRAVRIENRGIKLGDREGSWNKLLNRSQEQAIVRNQKNNDWRKVLDEQVREKQMKKQIEEERKRTQELEEENRYQRQIEELSNEYTKKKISLQKNGVLKQEPNSANQPGNASPLGQLSSNLSNANTKSMKDMRINRESPLKMFSPFPAPKNIREIRGKVNLREDDSSSIHVSYSIENRSRNENLNQYIENLKAEIYQGQEVFKNHMSDLKQEVYKLGKFRNIVDRNPVAEPKGSGFMKGIGASLPAQMIYKDVYSIENSAIPPLNVAEPKVKTRKIKPAVVQQEEEKFKWDTDDDFYSKLPASKQVLTGVQTMVKIEPVTEHLLAYKKPETPKKKWSEEEINIQPKKESIVEEKKSEVKDDNKLELAPIQTDEPDLRILPSFSSITEIRSTPKGNIGPNIQDDLAGDLLKTDTQNEVTSKPETHISIPSPRKEEKEEKPLPQQQDYVQIAKDFQQPLTMMLNNPNLLKDGTITPSLEYGSRREPETEKQVVEKNKVSQRASSRNEDLMQKEKEVVKVRRPMLVDREKKDLSHSGIKSREVKNVVTAKNSAALKAMTKFVAKDGLDAKIAGDQKLQVDPLARLDFMIDYLFNYNP